MIQKRKSGRYTVVVDVGDNKNRDRRTIGTFNTIKEAERAERDAKTDKDRGIAIPPSAVTVTDVVSRYIANCENLGRARKTTTEYYKLFALYIEPYLGQSLVAKLRPISLTDWIAKLHKSGGHDPKTKEPRPLGPKTVFHAFGLLNASLNWGVRQEIAARNICKSVTPPSNARTTAKAFELDEVDKLLRAAERTRWEHFIVLAVNTGARKSELLALNWSDISFDQKTVTVSKSMCQVANERPFVKATKTDRVRIVPLTSMAIAALRKLGLRQKEDRMQVGSMYRRDPADPVFTNELGERYTPHAATDAFHDIAEKAGVSSTRVHDMRHTAATYLIAAGVDIGTVSAILGHSNTSTTMDTYGHLLEGSTRRGIDKLGAALERMRGAV